MRRIFCQNLQIGTFPVDAEQAHHARAVLRLDIGDSVELFDSTGKSAIAVIRQLQPEMLVEVENITRKELGRRITVASAVPKGDRADWLVEKLSEIGVTRWIPLKTTRSVVHPDGASKYQRWERIATESAKQCKRPGVMEIGMLASLTDFLPSIQSSPATFLSTVQGAQSLSKVLIADEITLLIGPEGGWTDEEESQMKLAGLTAASLGQTILRLETAAIVSAGIVAQL